jgi:hypothetical protein
MNDYLDQLMSLIRGAGIGARGMNTLSERNFLTNAMGQGAGIGSRGMSTPSELDYLKMLNQGANNGGFSSGDPDGGSIDYIRQINQMPEEGFLKGMPISSGDIDGASHTLEQLIEQKMRNSGNTPMPQGFDIEKVREMIRQNKMR